MADADDYLERHLANELHWLLRATYEWKVQADRRFGINGYHVQVYTMDSAFLHARVLFEFFTKERTGSNYYAAVDQFGLPAALVSVSYKQWQRPLHAHLMHAQPRDRTPPLTALDGTKKDLSEMAPDFAAEIERLWGEFAAELRTAGKLATADIADRVLVEARDQAVPVLTNEMATRPAP